MADKMDEPLTKFAKGAFEKCTALSQLCPVKATVLGYAPNLGASIFFTVAFGLCTLAAIYLTIRHKTWTFGIAISAGLALETVGYAARTIMNGNPWHKDAFKIQICAIIISPTLICVSIYLTLKHISLNLNPAISRIKPRLFPLIFLPADLACLIVQAIGGGVAAAASAENRSLLNAGNNAIIAGITLQVVVLAVFGGLAVDYWIRVKAYMRCADAEPRALDMWKNGQFRKFGYAVLGAYFAVLIRCIYRIAEMSGGWGNHIMQDEPSFVVLDTMMILIATYLLTIFHPGIYFPQMANGFPKGQEKDEEAVVETSEVGAKTESTSD